MEIIRLKSVFKEKLWGGTTLRNLFNYDIPSNKTGECWAISALRTGDCEIANTEFKGKTLSWLYKNHREIFGNIENREFPLLVKLLDASDNLSIQVHPDDKYANEVERQEFGKTEAWYIVDCAKDSVLQVGHNANSKEELKEMVLGEKWKELLNYTPIKKGDFFYIQSGTVHAICKNTLVYEIQQSSDLTYRLYDYDRVEKKTGKKRELHTDKSLDVIRVPQKIDTGITPKVENKEGCKITNYVDSKYFKTFKYDVDGNIKIQNNPFFALCTVLEGNGEIDNQPIKKGDNFIIPSDHNVSTLSGNISIIVSTL